MQNAVAKQLDALTRGAEEVLPAGALAEKIKDGKPLRVKVGFDPTSPDLHLGHTVLMHKMRHFQEYGHTVIFLIGDFTAMIGDPSGRDTTRPPLSSQAVAANAATYEEQVFKILDRSKTEVRRNSEWFGGMSAVDLIHLAASSTVARMLERNDFATRYQSGQGICIHEFLYPLVQGYDSVALEADVELGGTDQKFNLLVGRELQRQKGKDGQCILTVPLLEGLDGEKKMSKSHGNHIGVDEPANDIYGKLMSLSDVLMWRYYELLSSLSQQAVREMRTKTDAGEENPMQCKKRLAREITESLCGAEEAAAAAAYFDRHVSGGALPEDIPEVLVNAEANGRSAKLFYLLKIVELVASSSDGMRIIKQGGVKIDGRTETDPNVTLPCGASVVIQSGKRRFAKVTVAANE